MLRNWLINIRHLTIYLLDGIFKLFSGQKNTSGKKRLLIIRLDAIGDFIVWLSAAEELRKKYKDYEITLVGNRLWCEVARVLPYFDNVLPVHPKKLRSSFSYRYRVFKDLRQEPFEIVMHPVYTREGYFLDAEAIVRMAKAERKYGFARKSSSGWRTSFSSNFYTDLIESSEREIMELERNADFVSELDNRRFPANIPRFPREVLPELKTDFSFDYIIVPGAGAKKRQWPIAAFVELADRIYEKTGWQGIICGGPGEAGLGEALEKAAKAPLKNVVGKTGLLDFITLIADAQLVISNETSAVHIGAAVSTKTICILGGGHFGRFVPYKTNSTSRQGPIAVYQPMDCFNCNWQCIYKLGKEDVVPCISGISVDAVWQDVEPLLYETESLSN